MIEQTLAAVFVIALLLATVWVLRRKGLATSNWTWKRSNRANSMQVIERLQLTAQHSLHLVRVDDVLILIGLSPSSCGQIASLRSPNTDAGLRQSA